MTTRVGSIGEKRGRDRTNDQNLVSILGGGHYGFWRRETSNVDL